MVAQRFARAMSGSQTLSGAVEVIVIVSFAGCKHCLSLLKILFGHKNADFAEAVHGEPVHYARTLVAERCGNPLVFKQGPEYLCLAVARRSENHKCVSLCHRMQSYSTRCTGTCDPFRCRCRFPVPPVSCSAAILYIADDATVTATLWQVLVPEDMRPPYLSLTPPSL